MIKEPKGINLNFVIRGDLSQIVRWTTNMQEHIWNIRNNHIENKISRENIKKRLLEVKKITSNLLQYAANSRQDSTGKQNPGREDGFEVDVCILSIK